MKGWPDFRIEAKWRLALPLAVGVVVLSGRSIMVAVGPLQVRFGWWW